MSAARRSTIAAAVALTALVGGTASTAVAAAPATKTPTTHTQGKGQAGTQPAQTRGKSGKVKCVDPNQGKAAGAGSRNAGSPAVHLEGCENGTPAAPKGAEKPRQAGKDSGKRNENCGNGRGKGGAEGAGDNQHGKGNTCGKGKGDNGKNTGKPETPKTDNGKKDDKGHNENCGNGRGKGGAEGAGQNEHGKGNTCGKGDDKPTTPVTPPVEKPSEPTTPVVTPPSTTPTTPTTPAPTTPPRDETTRPGSTVTQPKPRMVTRTFQVDRYMPKTAYQARVVASLDDDGVLRYREDKPLWGASRWQFVTISVPANASAGQVAAAINAKTTASVGDIRTGAHLSSIKAGSSVVMAWELGKGATTTYAWGTGKNVNQTFFGRS